MDECKANGTYRLPDLRGTATAYWAIGQEGAAMQSSYPTFSTTTVATVDELKRTIKEAKKALRKRLKEEAERKADSEKAMREYRRSQAVQYACDAGVKDVVAEAKRIEKYIYG